MHISKNKRETKSNSQRNTKTEEMEKWIRGDLLGRGSFGTVNLAFRNLQNPLVMAVKSALLSKSSSLEKEREVLEKLQECPQIVGCFGHDTTVENGQIFYNLFLEYAAGGSLAGRGKLPESEVRRHAAAVLKGLSFMHWKGLVHCDVKLQNLLLCSSTSPEEEEVKIADFGLAKKTREDAGDGVFLRGTPVCMAPESVARNEYEPPADIWGVGCAVVEMITGKPAWRSVCDATDINSLLFRIGFGDELPEIPRELSEEGKDFLQKCLVRDPAKRWTAEMLLQHPFVGNGLMGGDKAKEVNLNPSPRSVFDFMNWESLQSALSVESCTEFEGELDPAGISSSPADRILRLATGQPPNWSDCEEDWITSRQAEESPVSQLPEVPHVGCSVSSRSDSLLLFQQMVLSNAKRKGNLESSVSQVSEIQVLGFSVSKMSDEKMEGNSESSFSQTSEVSTLHCSVSSRSDSLLVLEQMMLIDGNSNSSVCQMDGIQALGFSVSQISDGKRGGNSISNEMEELGVSASEMITRFGFSRGELAGGRNTRCGNVFRYGNCRTDGSCLSSLSCKNCCSNCNGSSFLKEFKHRDLC